MRIGLLEESSALIDLFITIFSLAGHTVTVHTASASLLTEILQQQPVPNDLLILDVILDRAGQERISQLLQLLPSETLPIVVLTTSSCVSLMRAQQRFPHISFCQLGSPY